MKKPLVTWRFNGQPLKTNDRFQVTQSDDGRSILTIGNTQLIDRGIYTARARNDVGEAEAKTTLSIVGIKPVIKIDLKAKLQVNKAETITLQLTVSGTPKPEIVWMRDNDELVPNDRIHVTAPTSDTNEIYTLTILNFQHEDQGEYSAKINNSGVSLKSENCKITITREHLIFLSDSFFQLPNDK